MDEKRRSHVPWKSIAQSAPWVIWGLVALIAVWRLQVVTTGDLKVLVTAVMRCGSSN